MPSIPQNDIEDYINLVYDLMFELEENILKSATLNLKQNSN